MIQFKKVYIIVIALAIFTSCQKEQDALLEQQVTTELEVINQSRTEDSTEDVLLTMQNAQPDSTSYFFSTHCSMGGQSFEEHGFHISFECDYNNEVMEGFFRVEFPFEDVLYAELSYHTMSPASVYYFDQFGIKHYSVLSDGPLYLNGNITLPFDPSHEIRQGIYYSTEMGNGASIRVLRVTKCEEEIIGNAVDDDCDGFIDEEDIDQDGWLDYTDCAEGNCPPKDCDDTNAAIYPEAVEITNNGIDENCTGKDKIVKWEVSYNGFLNFKKLNKSIGLTNNIADLLPGDFDGDGQTDFLRADENGWVFFLGDEQQIVSAKPRKVITADQILIGDFDGNGIDDVLHATGKIWRVSYDGTSDWSTLRANTATKERMHIGDFNGDGIDDVAVISTQRVKYSLGGTAPFIKTEGETFKKYGFLIGDFDGDGNDDVFNGNGTEWRVLYSAVGTWQKLRNHPATTDQLGIGYFHQFGNSGAPNAQADIFKATGTEWRVWYQGKGVKQVIKTEDETDLLLGDFNGDGRTDVMRIKEAGL